MPRVLIVHASRHGSTTGIAERIGEVLRAEGHDAVVTAAAAMSDPRPFDACIVGGGVYMGSWVKDGIDYLQRYAATLATMPVWLFSSGPLAGSTKEAEGPDVDPIENALGPVDGPGSGGRKKILELAAAVHARDHRVFYGAYDPTDPPKGMAERVVRMMTGSKGILPPGDFRDWPAIEAWAHELAQQVAAPVPIG
jgi:menaquinone-dependent protoporphyrinogen oxidase